MNKFYKIISKISLCFSALFAVMGIFDFVVLKADLLNKPLPDIINLLLLIPVIILFYSWPFFLPVSLALLLGEVIAYIRLKPTPKKPYIRALVLHIIFSLIAIVGIFYVYYDKFGFPSF